MVCFSVTCAISWPSTSGQLRLVLDQRERAARDVHEPARRRERVDAVGVEHDERPRAVRAGCSACASTVPTSVDVLVHGRVLHDAVPLAQLRADVRADLPLFGVGERQVVDLLGLLGAFCRALPIWPSCARRRSGERQTSANDRSIAIIVDLRHVAFLPRHFVHDHGLLAALDDHVAEQPRRHRPASAGPRVASLMMIRVP